MRKKITLSIPKPCQEDWNTMTVSGNGKHCESCKTTVRDFSDLTDKELILALQKDSTGCGKFRVNQLDRTLVHRTHNLTPTFSLKAVALGIGVLITSSSFALDIPQEFRRYDLIEMVQNDASIPTDSTLNTDSLVYFIVQSAGSSMPIEGATIYFMDANSEIVLELKTESNGVVSYERSKLEKLNLRRIGITAGHSYGYQEIAWEDDNDGLNMVTMTKNEIMMLGVYIRD